ncbi:MAG TPA: hypothetical protein PKI16_02835 [Candidatus Dojkabacteria bacterium]|nr:hypothetical protein [Candidatus Dojkabacteria bacterium]
MNPTIETEHTSVEVLEGNLKQIEELLMKNVEDPMLVSFYPDMSETQEINDVLLSVGFLQENMRLHNFHLIATIEPEESFEFGLYGGEGSVQESSKRITCFFHYINSKKEGNIFIRSLQEEGKKSITHTHCLFKDKLDRLSNTDKKIFEVLTSKFLEIK